ncbi:O-methyltransferase [Zunongwangia endophytica]|uniref:O-methyltransferase n=1 Tax=Zunongwangia endophytica TaxID=1808945 RepID=A0ABV8H5V7_9FLAO|nr:class I SAM-dependent methyltransferase [Zunongwangia endophytica]MDN3595050.1 class I SAM-dependent methyltransferase [Zunongwangia endophytica]
MHQLKAYIKFLLASQNQHGLHSPFVYDLVTNCFYDKNKYPEYQQIKEYKVDLLKNTSEIEVTDFGAGSRVFKSNKRKVTEIAKVAGITSKKVKFLFRITKYLQLKDCLELGTSLGIASAAIASVENANLITLEGCPQTAKIAKQQFDKFGFKNIQSKIGEFDNYLSNLSQSSKFDFIYFDGNHQKTATLHYFEALLKTAHNNSVFIFDDIHLSEEMEEAWEEIQDHPAVQVTVDTFYLGLVFFRSEQAKQHFKIRL